MRLLLILLGLSKGKIVDENNSGGYSSNGHSLRDWGNDTMVGVPVTMVERSRTARAHHDIFTRTAGRPRCAPRRLTTPKLLLVLATVVGSKKQGS